MGKKALKRIAAALERMSPAPRPAPDFAAASAFVWHVEPDRLEPVKNVSRVDLGLLLGVDRARDTLLANTRQFADGLPANNALLWGARGMGKSSLVKAVHADAQMRFPELKLIELQREDLPSVGRLLNLLRDSKARFLLFFAMISRFRMTTSITNRSRPCLMAASKGGPKMWCSTPPRTAVT